MFCAFPKARAREILTYNLIFIIGAPALLLFCEARAKQGYEK